MTTKAKVFDIDRDPNLRDVLEITWIPQIPCPILELALVVRHFRLDMLPIMDTDCILLF